MDYNKYQKTLEKEKHGDGISLGAFMTGDFTLYTLFIFGAMAIGRVYGKTLMTIFTLSALAFSLLVFPLIFKFKRENSNNISYQLFWLSVFLGAMAFIIVLSSI
ncbi:hypothetical protein [Methanocaldococcus sp.]